MFLSKIRDRNIQKKINRLVVANEGKYSNNDPIRTVAILTFDGDFNMDQLQEMVARKLGIRNSKIYAFRKFNKDHEKSYKHFSEKDFNWKGNVLDTSLQSFIESQFDLLICFFSSQNLYLEYVSLLSKANFKVGFAEKNFPFLDLQINVVRSQVEDFFSETKKYLTILKKLDE